MWIAAADAGGGGDAAILAVYTFLGVVVTQLAFLIAPIIKSRFERTPPTSTPAATPTDGSALIEIARDQGVLTQRADDSDQRDDVQDVRLNAIERHLDTRNPEWRSR